MGLIFFVTPIDDRPTRINVWRLRKVSWPAPENLYQHDIGLVQMRPNVRDAAKMQARALFAEAS